MEEGALTLAGAFRMLAEGLAGLEHLANAPGKAAVVLEIIAGVQREDIIMEPGRALPEHTLRQLREVLARARTGMPLAYALGEWYFAGRRFLVNEQVLIPRPDTETLLEAALSFCRSRAGLLRVLELGVGSGAVIVSLGAELAGREVKLTGTDISPEALKLAAANARRHGVELELREGPLLEPVTASERFSLILSNPPYVGAEEEVAPEVMRFEPPEAYRVPAGFPATHFHRCIAESARSRLEPGGMLALEVGHTQAAEVTNLLEAQGYGGVAVARDVAGVERVVTGRWRG